MSSLLPISTSFVGFFVKPLSYFGNLINSGLQAVTGRGINFWSEPSVRNTKSVKNFYEFKLANGLKVIAKQAPGSQVDTELIVNVGAIHDPKGKEGLAHFLEHVVVSNTKEFADKVDEAVGFVGGYINAHTTFDRTTYTVNLPKDKLDLALRILAAQFSTIEFKSPERNKSVQKEKGIISSESYMTSSSSYNHVFQRINEILYGKHSPLTTNLIGNIESIKSIGPSDLESFYKKYYVPNNATLVISGDFDLNTFKDLVVKNFGSQAKTDIESKGAIDLDLKPSATKDHSFKDNTLNPCLINYYQIPKFNHRDQLILCLIQNALANGVNSRLYKRLIDKDCKLKSAPATGISVYPFVDQYRGHCVLNVMPKHNQASDQSFNEYQSVIDVELQNLINSGLEEDEFKRIIRQIEIGEIYSLDSQHAYIGGVTNYSFNHEDWSKYLNFLEDIKTVTNEEIKAFVAKYLNPANRYSFRIFSNGSDLNQNFLNILKQKAEGAKGKESKNEILDEQKFKELEALTRGQSKLEAKLTGLEKVQYNNSWELFLKRDTEVPVVFTEFTINGGRLQYPKEKSFINNLVITMINRMGTYNPLTKLRIDKFALDKLVDDFGVGMSFHSGLDHESITFVSPKKYFDKAVAIVNEFIKYPAFMCENDPELQSQSEKEFKELKDGILTELSMIEKFPAAKVGSEFSKIIFPEGHENYDLGFDKIKKIISNLTLADLREVYRKYNPSPAKVAVVGDTTRAELEQKLFPVIASWNKDSSSKANQLDLSRVRPVKPLAKSIIKVVEVNDNRPETNIIIGNATDLSLTDPDYYPALLGNKILGGSGLSSRLIKNLREEKGLVYSVGSGLAVNKYGSSLFSISLGCDPKNAKKSILAVREVLDLIFKESITEQELELAKNRLKLSTPLHELNSRRGTASHLSELQYLNRDENFTNNFNKMIDAITVKDVMKAMKRVIKPESFAIVVSKPKSVTESQIQIAELNKKSEKNFAIVA